MHNEVRKSKQMHFRRPTLRWSQFSSNYILDRKK